MSYIILKKVGKIGGDDRQIRSRLKHVLKCLIHGWNRIRRAGTFVVLVLRTTELREEMWNNLSGILPKEQLTSASQAPPQSAGSRAPRGHDPKAQWANLVSSQLSQALTAQDNA